MTITDHLIDDATDPAAEHKRALRNEPVDRAVRREAHILRADNRRLMRLVVDHERAAAKRAALGQAALNSGDPDRIADALATLVAAESIAANGRAS